LPLHHKKIIGAISSEAVQGSIMAVLIIGADLEGCHHAGMHVLSTLLPGGIKENFGNH
jgi:hypothetical protein